LSSQDEIAALQEFMWAGDINGDNEISYAEFVERFGEFVAELRPGNIKAAGHRAAQALADSDLMTRLFKHRNEFLDCLAKASTQSMRMVSSEELQKALTSMKGLKLSDDEIDWLTIAANVRALDRFDPVALLEAAAVKRGVELDVANRAFERAVAMDVEQTKLDETTLEYFRERALKYQAKVSPVVDQIMAKIGAKTGGSIQRAFRALDVQKKGVISAEDLVVGYRNFGETITHEQAQDIVNACDINQVGLVP